MREHVYVCVLCIHIHSTCNERTCKFDQLFQVRSYPNNDLMSDILIMTCDFFFPERF